MIDEAFLDDLMADYAPPSVEDDLGDCSAAALHVLAGLNDLGLRARVCHGYPLGTGGDAEGRRYWHAWVELAEVPVVIDCSNGGRVLALRDLYYKVGNIERKHVRRYTPKAAARHYLRYWHAGPWVDPEDEPYDEDGIPRA